jgi:hypothetical protein
MAVLRFAGCRPQQQIAVSHQIAGSSGRGAPLDSGHLKALAQHLAGLRSSFNQDIFCHHVLLEYI